MEMRSESNNRAREKTIAVVVLAAMLIGVWLPERLVISTSPSLEHRVFFIVSRNVPKIKTGDYLVFNHPDTSFVCKGLNKGNDRMIKKVGCSPGEMLSVNTDKQFFCKEKPLGKALTQDSEGKPLPQFHFTGTVPDNSFFMVGSNPRSFDSKYFGFVHADEILYKVLPLW